MMKKNKLIRPLKVKALDNYKIWLQYADGTTGDVDLSDLVGKGVFRLWKKQDFFEMYTSLHPVLCPGEMK